MNPHWMNIGQTTKNSSMMAQWWLNDYSMTGEAGGWTDGLFNKIAPARHRPYKSLFFLWTIALFYRPIPTFLRSENPKIHATLLIRGQRFVRSSWFVVSSSFIRTAGLARPSGSGWACLAINFFWSPWILWGSWWHRRRLSALFVGKRRQIYDFVGSRAWWLDRSLDTSPLFAVSH